MTPSQKAILSIDEGTSGTRAAIVTADGLVQCLEYHPLRVTSPRHGVVEQDANEILTMTLRVCRQTIARAKSLNVQIEALALSTQRSTAVLWDSETGKALVPAMVWQDARYAEHLGTLAGEWDSKLLAQTGRPTGIRSPYLWAARHLADSPQVIAAHRAGRLRFGTVDSWLLWHLSDEQRCLSTPTNVTSAGAYQLAEHSYFMEWLDTLGFPSLLLPTLIDDAAPLGTTRPSQLGIAVPILACLGDQFAGAIGLGCIAPGQALCMHGTGSFVDLLVGETIPALQPGCESTLVMTARRQQGVAHYAVETFVPTTGSALNWICENLGWFDNAEQISTLASQADSSAGVSFIPALTGLRVPHLDPKARASLTGVSIATRREHIARAILEGIAHSVTGCIHANEQATGISVEALVVGGGMSNSDVLMQTQADLSGVPVLRMVETARASLRGTAFLAGSSGLLWDSLADACDTLKVARCFTPALDRAARQEARARWQQRVAHELSVAASPLLIQESKSR
ncbi:glycerol kinase [Pluralibacter gergoviae]|uniref:FGGY family carbohydrate kinase n=1 Tax=Pluralibacter gergoviae TaxID=61647 RepID=UPI0005EC1C6B|nr:FGGY family carbohydrate kinase [Pluralibacter gergoviae]KJM63393.1 glycerol kinase [Pluralibacter gergoviae]KMK17349.1 glycerol kinase [Pluralibacter gergoviae]OUR04688.1 glycerol kinase [Pluralibacter gergoviae]